MNTVASTVSDVGFEVESQIVMPPKVLERWLVCPECGNEGEPESLMRFGYKCCRDFVNECEK